MKRILFTLAVLFTTMSLSAQKFAYVDTEYILNHIPEYFDAKAQLNNLSSQWQTEIEEKYESIARLEKALAAEKVLLTEEMKKKREKEIVVMKDQALEMQKQKFGVGGALFQKREELIRPIQERIYEALRGVAESGGYMVIFDKSQGANMIYTNPKWDISDKIIKKMGYTPGEMMEENEEEQQEEQSPDYPQQRQ